MVVALCKVETETLRVSLFTCVRRELINYSVILFHVPEAM